MTRLLVTSLVVLGCSLASVSRAEAEAILTLSGLGLQAGPNGELQLHVDVDLADAAPNLVAFDLDVIHAGLTYTSHAIGSAFDVDPLSGDEFVDGSLLDPLGERQNVVGIMNAPTVGAVTGRLFSMSFVVSDPNTLSLSLLGFPVAQDFEGGFRSESLVTELFSSPDGATLAAVPFIILVTSSLPGEVTLRLTTAPPGNPDPPTPVPEPTSLLLFGLGLSAIAAVRARRTQ